MTKANRSGECYPKPDRDGSVNSGWIWCRGFHRDVSDRRRVISNCEVWSDHALHGSGSHGSVGSALARFPDSGIMVTI